uniref:Alpha-2-macroglobulin-like 1 n=1 Tax=Oryzias melastigma TaxID=30732 RepID=A0A3B3CGI1_ORYME
MTITLDLDSSSTKIGELSLKSETYRCFQFMVPMVSSATVASISVKIQGRVDSLNQDTKVLIEPPAFIHIVQTDKPIYKPGQTVQFRIVSMDTNFIPVNRMVCFELLDPNTNRIAQWLDKSIKGGILDLSHPTIPEAAQGIYTITAETDKGEAISYNFEIKEYVLPKFEVTINLPSVITILDDDVTMKICGKYTYGKPVLGSVKAEFCRRTSPFFWLSTSKQKDICKTFNLSPISITFLSLQIKVVGADGSPIANQAVYLYVQDSLTFTLSTDQNGLATFSLDTSSWSESVSLSGTSWDVHQRTSYCVLTSLCALMSPGQVSLKFSATQELPGAKTTLTLQARSGSLCSVRAIDQSVLLLKSEQELTTDYSCCLFDQILHIRRCFMTLSISILLSFFFQNTGIKIITNSDVRAPRPCFLFELGRCMLFSFFYNNRDKKSRPEAPDGIRPVPMNEPAPARETPKTETIRTYFPETWIWDLVSVGSSGSTSLQKTVPDTITKWAAGAFCVSPAGFGVAPNVGLTAFQPFFVSLTLPYSVVRGEVFTLKATVFNYLPKCIMVKVTLANSDQFTFKNCDGCVYSSVCLCAEESKTFSWIVTPTALGSVSAEAERSNKRCGNEKVTVPTEGRIDTVITNLLVEAEGVPQMISHNALLCPKISLELPEKFVTGSERASVSVLGDLMGRAMKNLDKLLAMPYGCGEQNMLLFAPNIFILDYLKSTGQLKDSTLKTAVGYLESGYQRELNYKHDDGSYSAFGMSDASGNTWLTTFVMKSFNAAKAYIFVDQKYVQEARTWLSGLQKPDGCIQSVGKLFHNGMKGGVSDDVSLTAYVAAAMLELDGNASNPVVQKCLKCLKTAAANKITNLYTVALMSYTFTLAGDKDMRSKLITQLDQKSTNEGKTKDFQEATTYLDSVEVEMTSYVLLALLSGPSLPRFGLDYAAGIVRWLAQQQNPFGGFSSTQDTVVALQALAKYASATYSPEGSTTVTVTSAGGLNKRFTVNKENRLLYQEEKLSEIPGEYTIKAEGQSCVLAQVRNSREQMESTFQGRREETNMVVINIKLLSGYILQDDSLKMLKENRLVKRVDVEEGFINIYLDTLKKGQKETFDVTLEEDQQVENLKPAVVKVYDYYQTSDQAVTDYNSPCKK